MRPSLFTPLVGALAALLCLSACQGGRQAEGSPPGSTPGAALKLGETPLGQCALQSPLRQLGSVGDLPAGSTAQAAMFSPQQAPRQDSATLNGGDCAGNTDFLLGSGIQDMTGPAGDSISAGYEDPTHVLRGLHIRQFARAFTIAAPCNGQRLAIGISETGFITQGLRQTVLDLIAADPELAPHYGPQNVLLSATHTHSGPGGDAHHAAYNLFRLGYDPLVAEIYSTALYEAILQAHRNLEAHPEPGHIQLQMGELLDANSNRSEPAYANNPEAERAAWTDQVGQEVRVNKRMLQLRFDRADGSSIGLLNWFGVHTTSVGIHEPLISSDNKGYAALAMERIAGTDYAAPGAEDRFVAAFAQSDEGDSSPNICFRESPFPSLSIGCGDNTLHSTAAHGTKQLARAIELFDAPGQLIRGGLDMRLQHVPMDQLEITDEVVLASLQHPAELDESPKRTCTAALGFSMAAGAEDSRGPSQEGITCANIDPASSLPADIQTTLGTMASYATGGGYPALPARTVGSVAGCGLTTTLELSAGLPEVDYSCHAEKPILFPIGSTEMISNANLPLQIIALGQLAIVALPWEVTTSAARRIRQTVLEELRGGGVEYALVAGLSNDFVQYLTTREEYATQQYEAASTHFGPWTLAAVQQSLRPLAISLRDGTPAPEDQPPPRSSPSIPNRAPYIAGDAPPEGGDFGDVLLDAELAYTAGDSVSVHFASAHPRNDSLQKRNSSYLFAEREMANGDWEIIAQDRDPELLFYWQPDPVSPVLAQSQGYRQSVVEATWHLPRNLPAGRYRIRHEGTAVPVLSGPLSGEELPFSGMSSVFTVDGPLGDCPGYPALF